MTPLRQHLQRLTIAPHQRSDERICLSAEQQHYLLRVLRLRPGDRFIALDGRGNGWIAQLISEREAASIAPFVPGNELPIGATLAIALPKQGFDDCVRQATELGANRIVPLQSERALLVPSDRKIERWRRIAIEAAEQSERAIAPEICDPLPFAEWVANTTPLPLPNVSPQSFYFRYLCVARGDRPHLSHCLQRDFVARDDAIGGVVRGGTAAAIATGPEGGWTEAEIDLAQQSGFQLVSLGCRVLRAVTAPLAAMVLLGGIIEPDRAVREAETEG